MRTWGEAVAALLVETGAVNDAAEGRKLAGRVMAGAHMVHLDGVGALPDDGQLGRAWAADFLAGHRHLLGPLRDLSRDHLPEPHTRVIEALTEAAQRGGE